MILLGRDIKKHCFGAFIFCTIFSTVFFNSSALVRKPVQEEDEQPGLVNKMSWQAASISLQTASDTITNVTGHLLHKDYSSAKSIEISVPWLGQNIVIDWGFGGSGNIFEPLPAVPVKILSSTPQGKEFSLTEFGQAILKDEVTQKIKNMQLFSWLTTDGNLSPIKLYSIKLALLAKDYQQKIISANQFYIECLRLSIRLSLVENLTNVDTTKPLSSHLPLFIKNLMGKNTPEVLNIVDTMWDTVTGKQTLETMKETISKQAITVYACQFNTIPAADLYFKSIKQNGARNFLYGSDIKVFEHLTPTYIPAGMPKALHTAALETKEFPNIIKVVADDGKPWIAYISNRLGFLDTIKYALAATMLITKEYVKTRKSILLGSKAGTQTYLAYQKQLEENQEIQAFLNTDLGKKSAQRLTAALNKKANTTTDKTTQCNQTIEQLNQDIQALESKQQFEAAVMDQLTDMNTSDPSADLKKQINATQKHLDALEREIDNKQKKLATQEQMLGTLTPQNSDPALEYIKQRDATAKVYVREAKNLKQLAQDEASPVLEQQKENYIKHLEKTAQEIREQNQKARQLYACRNVQQNQKSLDKQTKEEINKLESEVGWLLCGNCLNSGLFGFLQNIPEFKDLVQDLTANPQVYQAIKSQAFDLLGKLVQQSDHIRGKEGAYRYLTSIYLPEFLPIYNRAISTINAEN